MGNPSRGILVALSAGGQESELAADGTSVVQVEDLMIRMASELLSRGHSLAFGGTIGNPEQRLTSELLHTAQQHRLSGAQTGVASRTPVINYAAWPNSLSVSQETLREFSAVCDFVRVDPPGVSLETLQAAVGGAEQKRLTADALTAMRERCARDADLRIVWGGRITGAAGWMAGILEEITLSLKLQKPVVVLGGFGGCAKRLADFLGDVNAAWPSEFSPASCADAARDQLLSSVERQALADRYAESRRLLEAFRKALHSATTANSLPSASLRGLLHNRDVAAILSECAALAGAVSGMP